MSAEERADEKWSQRSQESERGDQESDARGTSSIGHLLGELSSDNRYIRQSLDRLEADTKAAAAAAQEAKLAVARLGGDVRAAQATVEAKIDAVKTDATAEFNTIAKERKQLRWFIAISLTTASVLISAVMLWASFYRNPIQPPPSAIPAAESETASGARGTMEKPGQNRTGGPTTEGTPPSRQDEEPTITRPTFDGEANAAMVAPRFTMP